MEAQSSRDTSPFLDEAELGKRISEFCIQELCAISGQVQAGKLSISLAWVTLNISLKYWKFVHIALPKWRMP